MGQAKTDAELLETPPFIDVEGLVNRLREQSDKKSAGSPQSEALLGPDPTEGVLAKQGEFNHGMVTATGAMLEHLQRLERLCVNLEGKLAGHCQQELTSSARIAAVLERVESLEHKIGTECAMPADASKDAGGELQAVRQRLGQLNAMFEGREQLAYKQMAKLKRDAEVQFCLNASDLEDTRRELEDAKQSWLGGQDQVRQLAVQIESLHSTIRELKRDMAELDSRSREIESSIAQNATRVSAHSQAQEARIEEICLEVTRELNELDDLERRLPLSEGEGQAPNLPDQLDELRMRVLRTERQLYKLSPDGVDPAELSSESPAGHFTEKGAEGNRSNSHNGSHSKEPVFDYFAYQLQLRGSRAEIRQRQKIYLDLFTGCKMVLDLGCGRGEFIELLKESRIPVIGVDDSEDMAGFCQNRGLAVVCENMFDYLHKLPDAHVDGIMLSQVVEHLPPDGISKLLGLCAAKLQPGGLIVMESVNTLCPGVLGSFYMDPTHVRPVPARLLAFMTGQAGLKVQCIRFSQPAPVRGVSPMLETSVELAPGADQYQDYAIVGRKPQRV